MPALRRGLPVQPPLTFGRQADSSQESWNSNTRKPDVAVAANTLRRNNSLGKKKFLLSSNAKRWPNDWHFSVPPRSASSRHESRRTRMEISSSQPHLFAPIKLLLFFRLSHPALNSTRPQKFCLMSIGSPFDCCDASYTGAAVELNVESPKGCRKVRVGSCHSSRSSRVLDSLRRPADVVGKCCEPASKRVHSQRETCTRGGIRAVPAAS